MDYSEKDKKVKNFLDGLEFGKVIKCNSKYEGVVYFVVEESKNGQLYGQRAVPVGINKISISDLLRDGGDIEIADFKKIDEL